MGEKIDLRTPAEKQQEERRKSIVSLFLDMKARAITGTSDSRIMGAVSQKVGCTQQNVRYILVKEGVLKPRKRA